MYYSQSFAIQASFFCTRVASNGVVQGAQALAGAAGCCKERKQPSPESIVPMELQSKIVLDTSK